MKRKIPLVQGEIYHILSRSIAKYKIFNAKEDYLRMKQLLKFNQVPIEVKFSDFIVSKGVSRDGFNNHLTKYVQDRTSLVQIIAYCLMPTHIHLVLKQLEENGISKYFGNVLNSFSRHFNAKHKRKGPLWETKFNNVLVGSDEQLLHLIRYIHLNPVTALLVDKPEEWPYSSHSEYLEQAVELALCDYHDVLDINPKTYKKFVNDRISYQRELAKIKALILD